MSTAVLLALTLVFAPEKLLRDPQAQAAFDAAQKAFAAGDFATASDKLERAYMLEPEPELLYPWAQAERNLDRCASAIDLYQKFIDSDPSERMVEAAKQNIARCEETLAAAQPAVEPAVEPEPETDTEPPPPRVEPQVDDSRDDKPVGRDPAGGVLVGVGAAAAIVGVALVGVANKQAKGTAQAFHNSKYLEMREQATKLNRAGVAMLITGGVLVLAGVVRYGLLARKRKADDASAWWHGGRGRGIALTTRF